MKGKYIVGLVLVVATLIGAPVSAGASSLDSSESVSSGQTIEIAPTFTTESNVEQGWVQLGIGRNLLLLGNNLNSDLSLKNGLLFIFGSNLALETQSEYGFIFGNSINFTGVTTRDLYMAGNIVTLASNAKVGRDIFVAANSLLVESDLQGDLAATANIVTLKDTKVAGNVNLSVEKIVFEGKVTIDGALTYNENAEVVGLDHVTYGSSEAYAVQQIDPKVELVAKLYSKLMSVAALFLLMVVISALWPKLHEKLDQESTVTRFGTNLAMGLGVLIAVPVVAIFTFLTVVAAPLGIIGLVLYAVAIYASQGFTGAWLGHLLLEKLCKFKGNIFIEALLGIVILAAVSFIPYIGILTGFMSMLLGLGMIVAFIRAKKTAKNQKTTKALKA